MEQPDLAHAHAMTARRLATMLALGALLAWAWRAEPSRTLRVEVAAGEAVAPAVREAVLIAEARRLGWDRSDPIVARHLIALMRAAGARGSDAELLGEARALGVDQGDPVVRARLLDRAHRALESARPDPATLAAWHAAHPERFRRPDRVAFAHAFLAGDGDLGPSLAAPEDALQVGDPLLGVRPLDRATPERVGRFLGPAVADALREAPEGAWVGPVPSAYGRHWLYVIAREPGEVPPLDRIAAEVAQDWRREVGAAAAAARLDGLVDAWDVAVVAR